MLPLIAAGFNGIMSKPTGKARDSVLQQAELFRLAEHRFGLRICDISAATDIPESTLKGWRGGSVIPAWGLFALSDAGVPDELLSLVGKPFGKTILSAGAIDLEEIAEIASELEYQYSAARRPNSEAGINLGHRERLSLGEIADRLAAIARRR